MHAPLTRCGTPEHSARLKRERKASWRRIKGGEGYLYLAEGDAGCIKIGFSLNPQARCYELRLNLLATVRGTHRQEIDLHMALKPNRRRNEYYPRSILTHPAIPEALRSPA